MKHPQLAHAIAANCILDGRFTTASGVEVSHFLDKYQFESDPNLLKQISEIMAGSVAGFEGQPDVIAGIEMGGIPLTTIVAQNCNCASAFLRKTRKPYGTRKILEGASVAGKAVILVEDVVFSGRTVVWAIDQIRAHGGEIAHVISVVDRQSGGRDAIAAAGCDLHAIFSLAELLAVRGLSSPNQEVGTLEAHTEGRATT